MKLALDRTTGEHVALKIISQDSLTPDSRAFARLQNEVRTYATTRARVISRLVLTQAWCLVPTQIEAIRRLNHPNVIAIRVSPLPIGGLRGGGSSLTRRVHLVQNVHWRCEYPRKRGGSESVALLAMEFASQGELFSLLSHTGPLPEPVALALFRQLLLALSACHAAGVYHRDIKPENIVLDANFDLKVRHLRI